ncbi:MAG: ABC transporter permease [Chloroflexota bacterium]|nr:ABC transporter permease [Chloroflexota bacterium]
MTGQVAENAKQAQLYGEEFNVATQWQLMWWRFRKHKPAVASGIILALFYLLFPFAEFLGMGDPARISESYHYLGPRPIRFFDEGSFRLHVNGLGTFPGHGYKRIYKVLEDEKIDVGFFTKGFRYKFLGFIETDRHLFGFSDPDPETYDYRPSPFILGSDDVGRDSWSRLMLSNRASLSIGLLAVAISLVVGVVVGGISGYCGGWVDSLVRCIIEFKTKIPALPLWMILAAAVPQHWTTLQVSLAIAVILSILGWTGIARTVRDKLLSLREEDYVWAARVTGASKSRIVFRHMLPGLYSHAIAQVSLAIPGMIIGETSLSFLGLGLRPPAMSYGVMLIQVQNPTVATIYPWLMFVVIPVIIVILTFNFLADGLRDAADPYGHGMRDADVTTSKDGY